MIHDTISRACLPAVREPLPSPPLVDASDDALARRAGLGDRPAFEELFSRHFASTYRYALSMLDGDHDLALEAAQETWITVWQRVNRFEGRSRLRTWVFSIAARKVYDLRRRRRPVLADHETLSQLVSVRLDADGHVDSAEHDVIDSELWASLAVTLSELPWRQRAVWVLVTFEELSYDEIARILDTTPSVVRGQLHRARRAVAIRMEDWR